MRRPRRAIPKDIEKQVLVASRRKCCLCFFVDSVKTRRKGQLAHLSGDPSNTSLDDLVFLCLEHHDEFDSRTRQTKGFTPDEVRYYRDELYRELQSGAPTEAVSGAPGASVPEVLSLGQQGGVTAREVTIHIGGAPSQEGSAHSARPRFEVIISSATTLETRFSPIFSVRQISGDLVANLEWRITGPRFPMDWRSASGSALDRTRFTHEFDLAQKPKDHEHVGVDEMGFEIRFYWRRRQLSELHRWPITRRPLAHKTLWGIGSEVLPPLELEGDEIEKAAQGDQVEEWRSLINDITRFAYEGNRAMEAYGRPKYLDSTRGLQFMNEWIPRVGERLPDEYRVDFESEGRAIFGGDAVWAEQLDIRLTRLREIVADIRNRHL